MPDQSVIMKDLKKGLSASFKSSFAIVCSKEHDVKNVEAKETKRINNNYNSKR